MSSSGSPAVTSVTRLLAVRREAGIERLAGVDEEGLDVGGLRLLSG